MKRPPWSVASAMRMHLRPFFEVRAPNQSICLIIAGVESTSSPSPSASSSSPSSSASSMTWWLSCWGGPLPSVDPVDRVEFLQPDVWWRLTAQGILLLTIILLLTTIMTATIMLFLLQVRECAIGRSYDDCEGDAREERTCNADQVTVVMVMVMVENISPMIFSPQCPSWTPWTPWSECTVSCGGGKWSNMLTHDTFKYDTFKRNIGKNMKF